MFHRENEVLRAGTGIAVPGATITVYVNGTDTAGDYTNATKATIYPTNEVGTPIAGSAVVADANGKYEYYPPDGVYDEVLRYGAITAVEVGIQMYDIGAFEVSTRADAEAAAASADVATAQATAAGVSAGQAATSETNASSSASASADSATAAAGARDDAVTASNTAIAAANDASDSASAALISETNAAASETNAAASAANAGGSATTAAANAAAATGTPALATRSALALVAASAGMARVLTEAGREGVFAFDSSNLQTQVAADPNQGIYVAPSGGNGSTGAWVRKYAGGADPMFFGVIDDPNATIDQSGAINAWFSTCAALNLAPQVTKRMTVRIDSAVTYDPSAGTVPLKVDLALLYLISKFNGGLVIGSNLRSISQMEIRLPKVTRSGAITWSAEGDTALFSNEAGIILYNFNHCRIFRNYIQGFTIGIAEHSENFGYAYNDTYGGDVEDCRYIEVLRTVSGAVHPGAEFCNENNYFAGARRNNSNSNALGNSYGTVLAAAAAAYTGHNNNRWHCPAYELGSPAGTTYRVAVYLNGAGARNFWFKPRHEGGMGPFGIAKGTGIGGATALLNYVQMGYESGTDGSWRAGWLQVNGAYGNIAESLDAQVHHWSSGPLRGILSSGGAAATPRIAPPFFLGKSASGATPLRVGSSVGDVVANAKALQVANGCGLLLEVDTAKIKDWRIAHNVITGFGGRFFVACFDSNGNRLTSNATDTWGAEPYAKFNKFQAESTFAGGGYATSSDSDASMLFTVRAEVAKIWVGFTGGTNALAINGIDLTGYPVSTSQTSNVTNNEAGIGITVPTTDRASQRLVSADPTTTASHGFYAAGEFLPRAPAASGSPTGYGVSAGGYRAAAWAANTAYRTPGHCVANDTGKIYSLVTAGTSASTGGPTGTTSPITDGTCVWNYEGAQATFIVGPNYP